MLREDETTCDAGLHHSIAPKDFFFDNACVSAYCRILGIQISTEDIDRMSAKGVYDLTAFNTTRYGRFNSLDASDYVPTDLSNATKSYLRADTGLRQRVPTGGTLSAYYTATNERLLGTYGLRKDRNTKYLTVELAQSLLKGIGDKEARGAIKNALLAVEDSQEGRNLVISQVVMKNASASSNWTFPNVCSNPRP